MKYLFVTGGVLSGLGKGVTAASVGALLEAHGLRVFMQKFDGYLNVDPGTMRPYEHGEVFVTRDGAETDLDLGHYERFTGRAMTRESSYTSGRLYAELIDRERAGEYLGATVQIVPHLTDLVKQKIQQSAAKFEADVSIIEIGGTVGDMENAYFLEAARQLRWELGAQDVFFVHLTLLPYIQASGELKTKPTQHSVRELMSYGIMPDMLFIRCEHALPEDTRYKVARMCSLGVEQVIPALNVESIYRVPLCYDGYSVAEKIITTFGLETREKDLSSWQSLAQKMDHVSEELCLAMVGKYSELSDSYFSLIHGLKLAGIHEGVDLRIDYLDAEGITDDILSRYDGICVPGGFGTRGVEGMIRTTHYARTHDIPFLGICLGSQIMAIEFARHVLELTSATSSEFDPQSEHCIVHYMEGQSDKKNTGGSMRLGIYQCHITPDTLAHRVYGTHEIHERHRHRYEFNPYYRSRMEEAGFVISGLSPDGQLAEIVEIKDHPYMIACQFHPEFESTPLAPHPLFRGLVQAMKEQKSHP